MDWKYVLFHTIGGLGLFIYGMRVMSESLQHVAGDRMRRILETVSANRWIACFTGAIVTALVQSSSATTVMLVGFVNAGLLNLAQAVGVALGANIGTTMTAQLIAFKITELALPCIGIGVAMRLFGRKRRTRDLGGVILGFGMLFFGMVVMKMGVAPLKKSELIMDFFTRFGTDNIGGILLCVITGALATMVLQSSSATVGLTMTLATQGLLTFPTAVALILGENIGTTITAELSSIGTDYNARRTARAHTMFNVLGVVYMVILFPFFVGFVNWATSNVLGLGAADLVVGGEKPNIARYIANAHTLFNVVNAFVFLMLLPILIRAATMITMKSDVEEDPDMFKTKYLDNQFIELPAVALKQSRREILRMSTVAEDMLMLVINSLDHRKLKTLEGWRRREDALDLLQKKITDYLVQISRSDITLDDSKTISRQMRMVNNIERIGDSIQNVAELIEDMIENDIHLSDEGIKDYWKISEKVVEFYRFLFDSVEKGETDIMAHAEDLENEIDIMREEMRGNHLERLRSRVCTIDPGLIFTDMLNHFEKIGDYCFNISQAISGVK